MNDRPYIHHASVILTDRGTSGLVGKKMPGFGGAIWEDLRAAPYGEVEIKRDGGCTIWSAQRRSDGAYQFSGANFCAMFDAKRQSAIDLGPITFAAYGGTTSNIPADIHKIIADLRLVAYTEMDRI